MKHSVITGGAGFIGSHLAEALLARGDHVTALDDESTGTPDNLSAAAAHFNFRYVKGSVTDRELIRRLTATADEIYHLAATVGVSLLAEHPVQTLENNVAATGVLLEEIRREQARERRIKFFFASSHEVYGKNPRPEWSEDDDLCFGPTEMMRWSYGAAKAIGEFLTLAYRREHGLPTVIGRIFNVVGPRQSGAFGTALPRFVEAALAGGPLIVHDDGLQVRCFAHVADVVRAILLLMDSDRAEGGVFNVGSDEPIAILDLAKKVVALVNPQATIQFRSFNEVYPPDMEDCRRCVPDISRLRNTVGYFPRYGLDEILREVSAWKHGQI
ncbi:MAG: GDP-mannose 4,6-dehydratase [Pirellulales bacterium]|nr:GDP-mannose 4,6-dehydratase [Pirellulales bacterium]